jgi:putrescine transport system substrate-binding protein
MSKLLHALMGLATAIVLFPAGSARAEEEKILNVYNWSDYIGADTVEKFENATGIKVNYEVYDSNETLEAKLLAGHSDYDVVVPSGPFLGRQIQAGVYRTLNKVKLSNLANMDPTLMKIASVFDPGNAHSVPYFWGTDGIGYNVKKIQERMPDAPVNSLDMIFKPEIAGKFADCGIAMLDSPGEILQIALRYLGKDPHSANGEDYKAAEGLLLKVRPHIKYFHSSRYIDDMANGQICLALGTSGDFLFAASRAADAKNGIEIGYRIPKEGTLLWIDSLAIPADAPHPKNAMKFINFLMQPDIAAAGSDLTNEATPVKPAVPLVNAALRGNPDVFPPADVMAKLFIDKTATQTLDRLRAQTWARIKAAQ